MMTKLLQGILITSLLLLLATPVFAAKPTIAVVEFKNQSGAGWWRGGVGWELSGMLSNELAATKAFRVLERSTVESILAEQNLGASGRVTASTAARMGKMVGAKYLVMGTVTSYEERTSGDRGGVSFRGISLGGNKSTAYIAVDIRVVDSETGEIVETRTIEGTSKGGGVRLGLYRGGFGGNLASQKKTPAGKAIRGALILASDYLECSIVTRSNKCLEKFDEQDERRKESSRSAIDLDG